MGKPTVLITGCSDGGMGSSLAVAFHKKGYRVFATARNISKMTSLPSGIDKSTLDITSSSSIETCLSSVRNLTKGTLNMLINNAGIRQSMPVSDTDITAARIQFDIHLWGAMAVTQAFLPLLLTAHEQGQRSTIVLHSSVASMAPTPFGGVYNASKAAASMLFSTLRLELAPFGVQVVELKSGVVSTKIAENMHKYGGQKPKLPKGSLYAIAKDNVEDFMSADIVNDGMDPDKWAESVVGQLIRSSPPKFIWEGQYSTLGRAMQYLPTSLIESWHERITGLAAVKEAVAKKRKLT